MTNVIHTKKESLYGHSHFCCSFTELCMLSESRVGQTKRGALLREMLQESWEISHFATRASVYELS